MYLNILTCCMTWYAYNFSEVKSGSETCNRKVQKLDQDIILPAELRQFTLKNNFSVILLLDTLKYIYGQELLKYLQ